MPNENHGTDLFEIIKTTRSMRRLKPDPVPNDLIRKILETGVCAQVAETCSDGDSWWSAIPRSKRQSGPCTSGLGTNRWPPRYRSGEPAPGTSRERFERMLAAAEYLAAHIMKLQFGSPMPGGRDANSHFVDRRSTQPFRRCYSQHEPSALVRL